ncbi:MAG: zinc metalloprotease HtpX [Bifidobacteriaceae bacterium]|nr:zinc metalloprotease HtpX [Bifidobacteriaceae bacterium]
MNNGSMHVHGHFNGLKTTLLFALMWGLVMLIWWATGASEDTLIFYVVLGVGMNFFSYFFSDKLALASMHAQPVTEQEAPELYQIVRELSTKAGKPMPRIYIAPTMSPNAFATGRNERHAAVCCTQGILQICSWREIRGVLGHELMHVYNHDILTSAIAASMANVITYLGYALMYFGGRDDDDRGGNPLGALLAYILAPIGASLIQLAISRTREYDADEDGSKLTGDPAALASALQRIEHAVDSGNTIPVTSSTQTTAAMMIESPFKAKGIQKLFSTHPPTEDRIARLRQMDREMHGSLADSAAAPQYSQYAQPPYAQQPYAQSPSPFAQNQPSQSGYQQNPYQQYPQR